MARVCDGSCRVNRPWPTRSKCRSFLDLRLGGARHCSRIWLAYAERATVRLRLPLRRASTGPYQPSGASPVSNRFPKTPPPGTELAAISRQIERGERPAPVVDVKTSRGAADGR
jgi:hypothetical protein